MSKKTKKNESSNRTNYHIENDTVLLNPIPIFHTIIPEKDRITTHDIKKISELKFTRSKNLKENNSSYLYKCSNFLRELKLKKLKKVFQNYFDNYKENILGIDNNFKIVHSWITKNQDGSSHHTHNHPNSMFASCYYFTESNNEDDKIAPLVIDAKGLLNLLKFDWDVKITNHNLINAKKIMIGVKPHSLVIFPSFLVHGSEIQPTSNSRYMLGCNFFINGKIGKVGRYSNLHIKLKNK